LLEGLDMYARFYKFNIKTEYFDQMLSFFDETVEPLIESVDGHLGLQSVRVGQSESIMVAFYKNKESADSATEKAAPVFKEMAKWMSAPPQILGEGDVMRSLNFGY